MDIDSFFQNIKDLSFSWSVDELHDFLNKNGIKIVQENQTSCSFLLCNYKGTAYFENNVISCYIFYLELYDDPEPLDAFEHEDKMAEFFEYFEYYTNALSKYLGKPLFSDGRAASKFPKDQDAEWVSLWRHNGYRIMIEQSHEDKELPFVICLLITR